MSKMSPANLEYTWNAATRWRPSIPKLLSLLFGIALLLALGTALISGQVSEPENVSRHRASDAAIDHFWAIFHGNDYGAIPKVQDELTAALAVDQNDPTLYALLAATHFWHVGEYTRDPKPNPAVLQGDMPAAVQLFTNALNLDYYSPHPLGFINDDHLPGFVGVTTVHAGQMTNNPQLLAQGDEMLNFSVYQFPEFNNFNRWAAHDSDPKDSASYKLALDSLWQALDACVGAQVDRTDPDLGQHLYLQTAVGRKRACWSESQIAPHSFEGFMLNLANGLVKADQVDAAKVMYANARYASNYANWPYRQVLESIETSDLNARAALYANGNPATQPSLAVPNRSCVYCHAVAGEPAIH